MRFIPLAGALACSPIGPSSDSSGRLVFFSQAVTRNLLLFSSNADGSSVDRLVDDLADYTGPDWSPDGTQIVFASTRGGNANFDLYVVNANGTNVRRIYGKEFAEFAPSWPPDGTRIAFEAGRGNSRDIFVINADGTNRQRLTNNAKRVG